MKKYGLMIIMAVFVIACGKADETRKTGGASKVNKSQEAKVLIAEGMEFLGNQDVINAINKFDSAIKVDPQNSENYMVLGQVYLRLRNYDKAVDTFNAGTRIGPDNGDLYYFLGAANAVRFHLEADSAKAEFYKNEGIQAAKRCVEIYVQQKDEEKFKRALALLKSLEENGEIGRTPEL